MGEILGSIAILISIIIFSLLGMMIVRRFIPISTLESHHEVAGFIYAVVGVIYAVVLAFAILVVWEQHNSAEEKMELEANSLDLVYRQSKGVQDTLFRNEIKRISLEYARTLIQSEFPAMERMTTSQENRMAYFKFWKFIHSYQPKTEADSYWFDVTAEAIADLQLNRKLRILSINYGVPGFIWFALITGGVLTISFAYLFGTKKILSHAVMIFCLSGIIGLALILISALEHPFTGIVKVDTKFLIEFLELLKY